ncbi:hemolysin family protein [Granulicella tundricola]|uniref:CBS domain containing protein n=1 Tax=Granulicella tundricola (strain ATCC BAA-1859 / DSM 23138 / MP5ACTX9) TaxID=1198114 RepID=E8WZL9_GRATM|nr:hemolysin family protein [Granulicella tundricola]ADW69993.1 CBS domain containing protein [Granulicella tundricola MP5ACTX9]
MSFVLLAALLLVLAMAAYIDRVYGEMGKFLARNYQDNIDSWEERVEPKLKLGRESVAQSASVLRQLSLAGVSVIFGMQLLATLLAIPGAGWKQVAVTLFELVLVILIFDRLVPQVLFARTRGIWVVKIRYVLQALFYLILPITLLLGLLLSIAALAEPEDTEEEDHPSEAMDALLEAGEEEGILEESDRELVRSVVEFGDKVVREVMTPRPEIFAVPATLTLKEFTELLEQHVFSRVPVYRESLDHVTGIAFAHDLLQITDADAVTRTIAQMQRPAAFVPETKMVAELLREMQSEKQHMRIVIDEYGAVAGIVTIEDLLEAIVGNIADEHDETEEDDAPVREADGAYAVSGGFELSRLRDLFADQFTERAEGAAAPDDEDGEDDRDEPTAVRLPEHYESTTIGGLVSEIAGHIPLPGEVVEGDGLRLEVLASTDRRIDRVRVSLSAVEAP